jgi:hypothetical protein
MSSESADPRIFHRLIRNQRKSNDECTSSLNYDGMESDSPEGVRTTFANYFQDLGKPKDHPAYDQKHRKNVEADVAFLEENKNTTVLNSTPTRVTEQDVDKAIRALKLCKAPDPGGISSEHLVYAKDVLKSVLYVFFNAILQSNYVPMAFLTGYISPIWKKKGSKEDPTKYRGITVSSTIGKVFEEVLTKKLEPLFHEKQSKLQFGFTAGTSILTASLILSEATQRSKSNPTTVAAFLDAEKAFDVVWQDSLLRKLALMNTPRDIWYILLQWYRNIKATVKWEGKMSEEFPIRQGVRQGGKGSPFLYKIFIDDLLHTLEASRSGLLIGTTPVVCPTVADDITLLAEDHQSMQQLLDIVAEYTTSNRYNINASKSAVLVYNRKKSTSGSPLTLCGEVIPEVDVTTHLGVLQGTAASLNKVRIDTNVNLARRSLYSLMGIGLYGNSSLNPTTKIKIYDLYVIPRLLYGVATWVKASKKINILGNFHTRTLKVMQGLPDKTADVGALYLMGALPLEASIHRLQLSLLWNGLSQDKSYIKNIISRQYILDIPSTWTEETSLLLERYGLPTVAQLLLHLPSKQHWKTTVRNAVDTYWVEYLMKALETKSSLKYLCKDDFQLHHPHPLWKSSYGNTKHTRRAHIRAKLLTGTYTLQANRSRFNQNEVDPTCKLCSQGPEDREHFLASCPFSQDIRNSGLQDLLHIASSTPVQEDIRNVMKSKQGCAKLLLNPQSVLLMSSMTEESKTAFERKATSICYSLHARRWSTQLVKGSS